MGRTSAPVSGIIVAWGLLAGCGNTSDDGDAMERPDAGPGSNVDAGVIEGTCRHLVQDRMGTTGARWDVPGGEAVLKLRAIRCSGDWDDYWTSHEQEKMARYHQKLAA